MIQKLNDISSDIDRNIKQLKLAKQEIENMKKEYRRHNLELPRKIVANMIGCTPSHTSVLKSEGKLKSYRYEDVIEYINDH